MLVGPGQEVSYGRSWTLDLRLQSAVCKSPNMPLQIVPDSANVTEHLASLAHLQESCALETLSEKCTA